MATSRSDCAKFVDCEYPSGSSCIKHQVHELTDIHKQYGGFPKTYTMDNTQIHQRWWNEDELDFAEIGKTIAKDELIIEYKIADAITPDINP